MSRFDMRPTMKKKEKNKVPRFYLVHKKDIFTPVWYHTPSIEANKAIWKQIYVYVKNKNTIAE